MKHVLVVEDQKPVRDSIGDLLAIDGHQTRLVGDGQVALEMLLKDPFDLITLDLNMPSFDGISLIEALMSQEGPNRGTPIVVISAYLSAGTVENLRELGVQHCLSKPFEADELLALIRPILSDAS